jgi:hypothetical protein
MALEDIMAGELTTVREGDIVDVPGLVVGESDMVEGEGGIGDLMMR